MKTLHPHKSKRFPEAEKRGKFFIGTSGYQYDPLRGVFYPQDLPKKEWITVYARHSPEMISPG